MTIFICGDSTAASYTQDLAPMTGWGQVLPEFLPGIPVDDQAMAGRSSKSFLYEGRLLPVEQRLQPGDLVLIQFAHNDENPRPWRHTDPWLGYGHCLSVFIQTARRYSAVPVLLTPICLRSFEQGVLQPSHQGYLEAMRTLAVHTGTPLIDLYADSFARVAALGEEASLPLFMHLQPGVWPGYPEGRADDTHTTAEGARANAAFVASELRRLGLLEGCL